MLTKLATFSGVSDAGEPLNRVFNPGDPIEKVAGRMLPEVWEWLRTYKPDPNKIVVLVNALGAAEYWGQNANGDRFGLAGLTHDCANHKGRAHLVDEFTKKPIPVYGYKTFLKANPFVHHRNKDPNRAFGKVALALWNSFMKRVELVVILDRRLAAKFGAQHVIDKLDAGEFPDVSMGCRVPYDVCTICRNKSKTKDDYCQCIKRYGMGHIFDDGRIVGVENPYPRFFDISFVFIGADRTAKAMAKLAAMTEMPSGLIVPQSVLDAELLYDVSEDPMGLVKAAGIDQGQFDDVDEKLAAAVFRKALHTAKKMKRPGVPPKKMTQDVASYAPQVWSATHDREKTAAVKVGPPPKPNRKEYPFTGTIKYQGLTIHVENEKGSYREGTGPGGKKWRTHMRYHYGEIVGTRGVDRDKLDVYVGPRSSCEEVYVVHQNHPSGPQGLPESVRQPRVLPVHDHHAVRGLQEGHHG
jgi:hypothetical protein